MSSAMQSGPDQLAQDDQRIDDPLPPLNCEIPPMIAQSQAAFRRDLPQLLKERPWQWVAYHGDDRIGFGKTQRELYRDLRLRFQFAGEYVAFIDRWKVQGKVRRLCREVLGHSPSLKTVQDAIAAAPAKDWPKVVVDFADDPDDGMELPHDLLDR